MGRPRPIYRPKVARHSALKKARQARRVRRYAPSMSRQFTTPKLDHPYLKSDSAFSRKFLQRRRVAPTSSHFHRMGSAQSDSLCPSPFLPTPLEMNYDHLVVRSLLLAIPSDSSFRVPKVDKESEGKPIGVGETSTSPQCRWRRCRIYDSVHDLLRGNSTSLASVR